MSSTHAPSALDISWFFFQFHYINNEVILTEMENHVIHYIRYNCLVELTYNPITLPFILFTFYKFLMVWGFGTAFIIMSQISSYSIYSVYLNSANNEGNIFKLWVYYNITYMCTLLWIVTHIWEYRLCQARLVISTSMDKLICIITSKVAICY